MSFDTKFDAVRTLGANQVLSSDLTTKKQKGSFSCCIIRFFCGGADPEQYKMVGVAQKIQSFVSGNTQSLKSKTTEELGEFKAKLVTLEKKSHRASSAQGTQASAQLQDAIATIDRIMGKKAQPVAGTETAPKASASKKDKLQQPLLPKRDRKKRKNKERPASAPAGLQSPVEAATPAAPAPKQPASAPQPAKKPEKARDPRAAALAAALHGHTTTTVVQTETVRVPDAANVARFKALDTATQADRDLTKARADAPMRVVTDSNGMRITKVYQPRSLGTTAQVQVRHTVEETDVGALLRQKREEILEKKKTK